MRPSNLFHRVAAALLLALGTAQAADLTVQATQTPGASTLAVPQFNPAQGWLQQVTLTLTGTVSGSGRAEATGSGGLITLTWATDFTLQMPGFDGDALLTVAPQMQRSFSASAYDGMHDHLGSSGVTYAGLATSASAAYSFDDGATLDLFRGTGSVSLPMLAARRNGMTGPANLSGGIASQGSVVASVTYTYQPVFEPVLPMQMAAVQMAAVQMAAVQMAPVPEPGTWALMLAGLGLVGWLGARRGR